MILTTPPTIPHMHRALCATGPGALALKAIPVPTLGPDEVLVKVAAVALNPSDHKLLDQSTTVGAVSGADFSGTVVKLGENVSGLEVGDRVFSVVFGSNPGKPTNGAFAQYVAAAADLCMRVPASMDLPVAASMGMAIMTTGLVFQSLGLDAPDPNSPSPTSSPSGPYVLIHGGSTATGTIAMQILRLAGYRCVATSSPRNFDLVRSRGAEHVVDYHDPSCRDEIRSLTEDGLALALDCFGDAATMTLCYGALGEAGGKYTSLDEYPRKLTIRRRDVKHGWVLGWTMFGEEVRLGGGYHRDPRPGDRAFCREWARAMEGFLAKGEIVPHPLVPHIGGLAAVVPRLEMLRAGKVSGKKMVFPL